MDRPPDPLYNEPALQAFPVKEHEWCNKQLVIHVLVATAPAAWNDANIRASTES